MLGLLYARGREDGLSGSFQMLPRNGSEIRSRRALRSFAPPRLSCRRVVAARLKLV